MHGMNSSNNNFTMQAQTVQQEFKPEEVHSAKPDVQMTANVSSCDVNNINEEISFIERMEA